MPDLNLQIKNAVENQGFTLSEEAWNDISEIWEPVTFKRKTIISFQGQIEKHLYFVTEGVQRVYYEDDGNREATLVFSYPYSFTGVLDSFMLQSPSRYNFETLTNSILLKTSYSQFQEETKKHPEFDAFTRTAINYVVHGLLERIVELQCFSSEEKI